MKKITLYYDENQKGTSAPGHWSVLQAIVSSRAGHVSPPHSGSTMTSRSIVLVPPPQVTLHSPHGFQSPTSQSTGNVKPWWKGKYLQPEVSGPGILAFENPQIVRKKSKKKQEDIRKFQNANPNKFIKKYELFVSEISLSGFSVTRRGGIGELATMCLSD